MARILMAGSHMPEVGVVVAAPEPGTTMKLFKIVLDLSTGQ
jgi:hypothetical protein